MERIEILLVEDNQGDVRLTREALSESTIATHLNVVNDGAAALEFLERKGPYADAPVPQLILLDLNLPKVNGRDVLARIKAHPEWRVIPVVILTTSSADRDIRDSYAAHVNCYITKPMSFAPFLDVVQGIGDFWLKLVRLPRKQLAP